MNVRRQSAQQHQFFTMFKPGWTLDTFNEVPTCRKQADENVIKPRFILGKRFGLPKD
jgi:hypothetical protein